MAAKSVIWTWPCVIVLLRHCAQASLCSGIIVPWRHCALASLCLGIARASFFDALQNLLPLYGEAHFGKVHWEEIFFERKSIYHIGLAPTACIGALGILHDQLFQAHRRVVESIVLVCKSTSNEASWRLTACRDLCLWRLVVLMMVACLHISEVLFTVRGFSVFRQFALHLTISFAKAEVGKMTKCIIRDRP